MYRFRDPHGRVIYVGKAKNLRSRLNSYFANPAGLMPKTYAMVHTASSVEWTVVGSELESLQLVPLATAEQVPTLPGTLQALQLFPVQAESQQTPSVQKPVPHSALETHAPPWS